MPSFVRSFLRACGLSFAVATGALACASSSDDAPLPGGDAGSSVPGSGTSEPALFSPAVTSVVIEIDYQPGAEPFTGRAGRVDDVWRVSRDNLARMFERSGKVVTLPSTLDAMQALPDVTGTTFTSEAILAIAAAHRDAASTADTATFYAVFLDGYFQDDTGTRDDVLAVSIGTTRVLALFKPVIGGADALFPGVAAFVEQSTFVHEFGHAIGLVDAAVPATTDHHDAEHRHHCTNERCVMFWANERASSAVTFARQILTTGSTVLLDDACLADLDAVQR